MDSLALATADSMVTETSVWTSTNAHPVPTTAILMPNVPTMKVDSHALADVDSLVMVKLVLILMNVWTILAQQVPTAKTLSDISHVVVMMVLLEDRKSVV